MTERETVKISVANGYQPSTVEVKKGVPTRLVFNRTNSSACLAKVQSKELAFDKDLPLNKDVAVEINTDQPGEYDFACGMGMFHGKVVVK